jgi:hypothetical protein
MRAGEEAKEMALTRGMHTSAHRSSELARRPRLTRERSTQPLDWLTTDLPP